MTQSQVEWDVLERDEGIDRLKDEFGMTEQDTPQETTDLNYDGGLPSYMENM